MTFQRTRYKIALIGYTLNSGGLERVMSSLSLYLGSKGIEVHNIVLVDDVVYPYSGTLVNIGKMKENHEGVFGKWKLFLYLKRYLKENNFDYIIDFRYRIKPFQEVLMANWVYKTKTIYTVHSGNIETYIPRRKWLSNLIFRKKYAVVCVSEAIEKSVFDQFAFQNLITIHNPVNVKEIREKSYEENKLDFRYVVGLGRFDYKNVKQFDKLIAAYLESELPGKEVHLVLIGEGERRETIEKSAGNSPFVHFLGFKENPYPYLRNAEFLILSSKYEGFPMSVVEALACGTPVVAFDCVSGPNEIIIPNENGLLVENQNFEDLKIKMNRMVADTVLRQFCKQNAVSSIERFSIDKIGQKWLDLMKLEVHS
ncbi:glycosyltransferase [Flavobacterium enshiense]|uniref:glycosyltransferase n=1 Tax=Flavobacterium enshiense TaxID=1341165 RepID=UPI00345D1723